MLNLNGVSVNRFDSSNPKYIDDTKFIEDYNKYTSSSLKLIVDKEIILAGNLNFSAIIKQEKYEGSFIIKVIFSDDYPTKIPSAYNVNNEIKKEYKHFLKNSNLLCLGVPTDIFIKTSNNDSLEYFLKNILIPYYISYQYWDENNGKKLFDERSHGINGIIEFYLEHFHLKSRSSLYQIFDFINSNILDENELCLCGSGLIYQNCHNKQIQELIKTPYFKNEYMKTIYNRRQVQLRLIESMNSVILKSKMPNRSIV